MNIKPAIDLLAARRVTNGYADLADMLAACNVDPDDLCSAQFLHEALCDSGRVAVQSAIGIDEPTRYRLLA